MNNSFVRDSCPIANLLVMPANSSHSVKWYYAMEIQAKWATEMGLLKKAHRWLNDAECWSVVVSQYVSSVVSKECIERQSDPSKWALLYLSQAFLAQKTFDHVKVKLLFEHNWIWNFEESVCFDYHPKKLISSFDGFRMKSKWIKKVNGFRLILRDHLNFKFNFKPILNQIKFVSYSVHEIFGQLKRL